MAHPAVAWRQADSWAARTGTVAVLRTGRLLAAALLVGGCATAPPPPCPDAQFRRVACAGGARVLTYDESLDPARYCEAIGELARRSGPASRAEPPVRLSDGVRTMNTGLSGWLLFAPSRGLADSPAELRRFWQLRNCVPPPP